MKTAYYFTPVVASAYGACAYGDSNYQSGTACGTASGGGSTSSNSAGGGLSNTGIAVMGIVTLAAMILLVAMVVRIWKRPSRQVARQEEDTED